MRRPGGWSRSVTPLQCRRKPRFEPQPPAGPCGPAATGYRNCIACARLRSMALTRFNNLQDAKKPAFRGRLFHLLIGSLALTRLARGVAAIALCLAGSFVGSHLFNALDGFGFLRFGLGFRLGA